MKKFSEPSPEVLASIKARASFRGENNSEAQFCLAWCSQNGLGGNIDLARAAKYFWIAANQGHTDAQHHLAACLSQGSGVVQDIPLALTFWTDAAKNGHKHSAYILYHVHQLGFGVPQDLQKADEYKTQARTHPMLKQTNNNLGGEIISDGLNQKDPLERTITEPPRQYYSLLLEFDGMPPVNLCCGCDSSYNLLKSEIQTKLEIPKTENIFIFQRCDLRDRYCLLTEMKALNLNARLKIQTRFDGLVRCRDHISVFPIPSISLDELKAQLVLQMGLKAAKIEYYDPDFQKYINLTSLEGLPPI